MSRALGSSFKGWSAVCPQFPLPRVLAVRLGTLAARRSLRSAWALQGLVGLCLPQEGCRERERELGGPLLCLATTPAPRPACEDRHSCGIPLKCERRASFEHSLEARPRPHEEKGCRPNPLELDSDTGGPGHSQRSRAGARRLGPFLGRRGLGEFCSGALGSHAGSGLGVGRGGWRLLSGPRAGGAVSSGRVPTFLGLSWWAGCRHPGPGRVFAGFALQSKGACPRGRLGRCLELQVPVLIMWRGPWTGPRLASVRGSASWFPCTTCCGPGWVWTVLSTCMGRPCSHSAVYTCGSPCHPSWERRELAWVSLPKVSPLQSSWRPH